MMQSRTRKEFLYNLIVFAIYVIILTVLLRFLWNQSLVKHITILKPVDTLWHTFLLAFAFTLFKC